MLAKDGTHNLVDRLKAKAQPLYDSTPDWGDKPTLKKRAEEYGYLYFKGLINKEETLALKRKFLEVYKKHRLDVEPVTYYGGSGPDGYWTDILHLYDFHKFPHNQKCLKEAADIATGGDCLLVSRLIARVIHPQDRALTTLPHQDTIYSSEHEQAYTCWVPLGDVPEKMGGLMVAKGSHKDGCIPAEEYFFDKDNKMMTTWPDNVEDYEWHTTDYEVGDFLMFHFRTIHAGSHNESAHVRFSCDFRMIPKSETWQSFYLIPHLENVSFDQIYNTWDQNDIKYYWKDHTLDVHHVHNENTVYRDMEHSVEDVRLQIYKPY